MCTVASPAGSFVSGSAPFHVGVASGGTFQLIQPKSNMGTLSQCWDQDQLKKVLSGKGGRALYQDGQRQRCLKCRLLQMIHPVSAVPVYEAGIMWTVYLPRTLVSDLARACVTLSEGKVQQALSRFSI